MGTTETDDVFEPTESVVDDSERVVDRVADDALPDHLDVDVDVPIPDVIDQRRAVVQDDDDGHR